MQVLQTECSLLDDVGDDWLLHGIGTVIANIKALPLLDLSRFPEILQYPQQRSLRHEGRHDPQRGVYVEAAVAAQNVAATAKTHREHFFPNVVEVNRRILKLQHLYRHVTTILLAVRFVHDRVGSLRMIH